jgi:hydroxymethylglutaryl-CoA lyase
MRQPPLPPMLKSNSSMPSPEPAFMKSKSAPLCLRAGCPNWGDAREVLARITRKKGVTYSALVPNERGLDGALAAKVDKIAVFTAASETFNRKNINASIKSSIQRFRPVVTRAAEADLPVRGYISTAFWCAFEGRVAAQSVVDVARMLTDIGVGEVSISDTVGKASPDEVESLLNRLLSDLPAQRIAVHFHDTYGRGIPNVLKSWEMGIRTFDASAGGLGGCPYSPGPRVMSRRNPWCRPWRPGER